MTTTTYAHDMTNWILGLPASVTTNGRNEATYTYDGYGQKTSQTRYGHPYATFGYNFDGTMHWFKDANGTQTTASEWNRGTPQTITRADSTTIEQNVDDNGWVMDTKDPNGNTVTYARDTMGRMTNYAPSGPWLPTSISYNFSSNIKQTISKNGATTEITYDAMFRPVSTALTGGNTPVYTKTSYDAAGQTIFNSLPSNAPNPTAGTNTTYDGLGRVTGTSETMSAATTSTTYLYGNRTRVFDALGNYTTYYKYGYGGPGKGDLRAITQPFGVTTYTYRNIWGELTQLRQKGTQNGIAMDESQFSYYDSHRRVCRRKLPDGKNTLMAYDPAGYLTSYAKGQATSSCDAPSGNAKVTLNHDALGRVTLTNFTDTGTPDIIRAYDNNGNVTSVNRNGVDWAYVYNTLNLVTDEVLSVDSNVYALNYDYNGAGHMKQRTLPSGLVLDYEVNALGQPEKVEDANSSAVFADNMTYHVNGAMAGMSYGNGQVITQDLDTHLRPWILHAQKGSVTALDLTYTYDLRGKMTSMLDGTASANNRTYGYDALGRLISASGPWGSGSYTYDALANLRTKTLGSRIVTNTYNNSLNRATSSHDSVSSITRAISYDTRGNVTTLGSLTFVYDYSDQPIQLSGSANGSYLYDGNLKRVRGIVDGKTIYNVYDASGTLVHIDKVSDNEETDYIGKIARVTNGVATYSHLDHLGSAVAGTDASGAIDWIEQYTPFGEKWIDDPDNHDMASFTGHIDDKTTGLTYMQARYYDPAVGRFLSIDPVGFSPDMPFMFNSYAYVGNDPMNAIDPFGEQTYSYAGKDEDNISDESAFKERAEATGTDGATQWGNGDQLVNQFENSPNIEEANVFSHGTSDGLIGEDGSASGNEGFYNTPNSTDSPDASYVSNFTGAVQSGSIDLAQDATITFYSCNSDKLARNISFQLGKIGRGDVSVIGANGPVSPIMSGGREIGATTGQPSQRFNTYKSGAVVASTRERRW